VNESDLSENSTPVNSPFLPPIVQQQLQQLQQQQSSLARRPVLVKQKRSFHAPGVDAIKHSGLKTLAWESYVSIKWLFSSHGHENLSSFQNHY
jgi:hypothetical protein